jgi:hypothetical protein
MAARETRNLSLAEALQLVRLYGEAEPVKFERAALRWHARYCPRRRRRRGSLVAAELSHSRQSREPPPQQRRFFAHAKRRREDIERDKEDESASLPREDSVRIEGGR